MIIIRFKLRFRRSVFFKCSKNLTKSSISVLLSNVIPSRISPMRRFLYLRFDTLYRFKPSLCNRTIRSRKTYNFNHFLFDPYFYRFPDIIRTMINYICKCFFQCCIWIIVYPICFYFIRTLNNFLKIFDTIILIPFPAIHTQQ